MRREECSVSIELLDLDLPEAWLASQVERIASFPNESVLSSTWRMGYKPHFVTGINLRLSTHKRNEPSFFGANTMSAVHCFCADSFTYCKNFFSNIIHFNSLVFGPAWYGKPWMGWALSGVRPILFICVGDSANVAISRAFDFAEHKLEFFTIARVLVCLMNQDFSDLI